MTEKELRAAGMYYRPFQDKELRDEYQRAAGLVFKLNSICNNDYVARYGVLRELFGGIGEECTVVSPFHCDFGYNITVGEKLFANVNLVIIDCARVTIGNNVFIGPNVGIYTAGHPEEVDLRIRDYEYAYPVTMQQCMDRRPCLHPARSEHRRQCHNRCGKRGNARHTRRERSRRQPMPRGAKNQAGKQGMSGLVGFRNVKIIMQLYLQAAVNVDFGR